MDLKKIKIYNDNNTKLTDYIFSTEEQALDIKQKLVIPDSIIEEIIEYYNNRECTVVEKSVVKLLENCDHKLSNETVLMPYEVEVLKKYIERFYEEDEEIILEKTKLTVDYVDTFPKFFFIIIVPLILAGLILFI